MLQLLELNAQVGDDDPLFQFHARDFLLGKLRYHFHQLAFRLSDEIDAAQNSRDGRAVVRKR